MTYIDLPIGFIFTCLLMIIVQLVQSEILKKLEIEINEELSTACTWFIAVNKLTLKAEKSVIVTINYHLSSTPKGSFLSSQY